MPQFAKEQLVSYAGTGLLSWLPDRTVKLGLSRIKSKVDSSYYVVTNPGSAKNLALYGEILCPAQYETKRVIQPRTFDSLQRAALNIKLGIEQVRLPQLVADEASLQGRELRLRSWKQLSELQRDVLSVEAKIQSQRLGRAKTYRRLQTSERVAKHYGHRDSLGRLNPLMERCQLLICIRLMRGQLQKDQVTRAASNRRIEFSLELADEVMTDLDRLLDYLDGPLDDVNMARFSLMLDRLQIKPFTYAVNFSRWVLNQDLPDGQARRVIKQAWAAELRLIDLGWLLSEIRDYPKTFDSLALLLADIEVLEFGGAEQMLGDAYLQLAQYVVQTVHMMQSASQDKDWDGISRLAKSLKLMLRQRWSFGYADVWLSQASLELLAQKTPG